MPKKRKAKVNINNHAFYIRPGSYSMVANPPMIPKFSTGDTSYSDLTAWQYWAQSDWSGGSFQKYMIDDTKFRDSEKVNVFDEDGEIKLENTVEDITINWSGSATNIHAMGAGNSKLYIVGVGNEVYEYNTVSEEFDFMKDLDDVGTIGSIRQILPFNGDIYFLGTQAASDGAAAIYDVAGTSWSINNNVNATTQAVLWDDKLYYASNTTGPNKSDLIYWDGSTETTVVSNSKDVVRGMCIHDSKLYLGTYYEAEALSGDGAIRAYDGNVSYDIHRFVSLDTNNNSNFSSLFSFKNKLYTHRYTVTRGNKMIIYSYNGSILNEEIILDDYKGITNINGATESAGILYLCPSSGDYDHYLLAHNGRGFCKSIYCGDDAEAFTEILSWNDSIYMIRDIAGTTDKIYRVDNSNYESSGFLESSILDMDMFSIDKYFDGITIYHSSLPANTTITVKVKIDEAASWTEIGSNSTSGTTSFDCQMTSGNTGKKIEYRLDLETSTTTSTPTIQDIVIRYILNPAIKKKWTFDVWIANNMEEYSQKKSASQLKNELWNALQDGVVSFTDIDGKIYDSSKSGTSDKGVLVDDVQFSGAFPFGENGPEFIATVTFIEG